MIRLSRSAAFTILLFFSIGVISASAQNKPLETAIATRAGKLMFFQVRVNGAGPFSFVLDSGAHHSVIDPYVAGQAKLKIVGSGTTTGTGQGAVQTQHAGPAVISLGKLRVEVSEPLVIDLSGVPIPRSTHGLIGAEFFEKYVVEIDPERPSLRFFDPATFVAPADAAVIPLIVENHRFFLNATLEPNDQEKAERKLRIDTGSEDSVADELVKKGLKVRSTVLGRGLGQNYQGSSGVLKAVQLGPFRFEQVWGPGAPHSAIGMEIFRRFTATFDTSRGKLYLKPNKHINEPVPEPPQ